MTVLRDSVTAYLHLRRSLGFRLKKDEHLLGDFASFMEKRSELHITAKLAVQWAKQPASGDMNYLAGRLRAVRSFARHHVLSDPQTEIPSADRLPRRKSTFRPHIFSREEIERILADSLQRRKGLKPITRLGRYTIYGLLSVTGMRVSEARNLDVSDVDLDHGVITIRNTKFGKSRLVPVHDTTCAALRQYREQRDAFLAGGDVEYFFISQLGHRICHGGLDRSFRRLMRRLGLRDALAHKGPRLHDLRHSMAVEVLRQCYQSGADPERRLPALSTYLGHTNLSHTYWYLHQNPELMTEAMGRLQHRWESPP
jgi:integrase/recombinase XerD